MSHRSRNRSVTVLPNIQHMFGTVDKVKKASLPWWLKQIPVGFYGQMTNISFSFHTNSTTQVRWSPLGFMMTKGGMMKKNLIKWTYSLVLDSQSSMVMHCVIFFMTIPYGENVQNSVKSEFVQSKVLVVVNGLDWSKVAPSMKAPKWAIVRNGKIIICVIWVFVWSKLDKNKNMGVWKSLTASQRNL